MIRLSAPRLLCPRRRSPAAGTLPLALAAVALPFAWSAAPAGAQQPDQAVRLEARPAQITVQRGAAVPLEVVMLDASGAIVDAEIRISGRRGAVEVDDGVVRGMQPGDYELVATAVLDPGGEDEPVTLRIPVRVTWPPLERIEVEAGDGTLYAGTTLPHRAAAYHADGSERPDIEIAWSTSDPEIATVDPFGNVTAHRPGEVRVVAQAEGVRSERAHRVRPFPATGLELEGGADGTRTGDVVRFDAVAVDDAGRRIDDLPLTWTHTFEPTAFEHVGAPAPGQLRDGRFVADLPGLHTVVVAAGPLSARRTLRVEPRDVVREVDLIGSARQNTMRTTDFWVFEGVDGRDYVITGSKLADGHAFVFDVTDPGNIVKTDSVQVDARTVNDVKVSPDGRYATMTREGASDRRNGVVILDLADPAHPVIAAQVTERLTGGVHNAFPTDTHVYALSNGDKYVILDVTDIYAPRIVGEYDHPDSRVHDVWVRDGLAFSAEWGTGVVVTDVGNGRWGGSPENPVLVTTYPLPTGGTHAVFPYEQPSTGKYYLFVGDEIMSRRGRSWGGYPGSMGSYATPFDPETGANGIPLATQGYIQVVDFTDPESPEMVARYEVPEYGTHNIWVEDDVLYQAYYEGGLRVVDVSGELMGNLYTQGREMAVFKSVDPLGFVPNSTMVWSAMPHKGHVFLSDTNSGVWAVKVASDGRPVS